MKNASFAGRAMVKAGLLITGSTYIAFALGLVVNTVVARSLGPEDFGRYAYLVWLAGLLTMIAVNGLSTTAIRFVSESLGRQEPQAAAGVHAWLWRGQLLSAAVVVVGFLVASPWLRPAGWTGSMALFVAVICIAFTAKSAYLFDISVAKGHGRFTVEAISNVVMSLASALGAVALALLHAPLVAFLLLFAAISAGYGLLAWRLLHRAAVQRGQPGLPPPLAKRLKDHLWWTVVLALVAALSHRAIETLLLNRLVGAAEVGYFAIAAALTRGGIELLTSGLNTVLMPAMAHAYGAQGAQRVHAILGASVRYFFFAGLLLAGVGVLWADTAVTLLYGQKYHETIWILQAMLITAGVTLPEGALGAMLSTTDNQRLRAIVAVLSLLLSATAAFTLVPIFGLRGAVASLVLSGIAIMVMVVLVMQRLLAVVLPWRQLCRLALAAAIAFAAVALPAWWSGRRDAQVLAGVVYAPLLVALSIAMHGWRREELKRLAGVLDNRPGLRWLGGWLGRWSALDDPRDP